MDPLPAVNLELSKDLWAPQRGNAYATSAFAALGKEEAVGGVVAFVYMGIAELVE